MPRVILVTCCSWTELVLAKLMAILLMHCHLMIGGAGGEYNTSLLLLALYSLVLPGTSSRALLWAWQVAAGECKWQDLYWIAGTKCRLMRRFIIYNLIVWEGMVFNRVLISLR